MTYLPHLFRHSAICLFLGSLMIIARGTSASAQPSNSLSSPLITRPPQKGDFCIVGGPGHARGEQLARVFLYQGRWVGVCPAHTAVIQNADSLAYYFAHLQPRGALYQEDAIVGNGRSIGWGWFVFGVWVAVALVCGAVCTHLGLRKGMSAPIGFFIGLLGNVVGVAYLLIKPARGRVELPAGLEKIPTTAAPVPCPDCGASNHPAASECTGCGKPLKPAVESEVRRALGQ